MAAISDAALRAWWSHRQGLDGSLTGFDATTILSRTGWARSVAGVGPYLTFFSRGGVSREQADAAVAAAAIHELPSARGCTYILPAADYALGLKVGQPFRDAEMNTARKLGVTDQEVEQLCAAVVKALGKSVLDPDQIRDAVGPAARSLGEEGKKKGVTTTLPLALGKLQAEGEIRRVPVNGRLDQQRYKYTRWSPSPLAGFQLTYEQACTELARRYFSWIGPATLGEFQWFSGLSGKAAKAAVEPLKLAALGERWMHAEDLDALGSFAVPKKPQYTLVSSLDAIALLRRELLSLVDPADRVNPLLAVKDVRGGGTLMDLPNHAILDRGRVVGLWEFDTTSNAIAWSSFLKVDAAMKQAVAETESFVRDQLGDARSFSLDSPKSREPKVTALRAASDT